MTTMMATGSFKGVNLIEAGTKRFVSLEMTINYFEGVEVYYMRYEPEAKEGGNI